MSCAKVIAGQAGGSVAGDDSVGSSVRQIPTSDQRHVLLEALRLKVGIDRARNLRIQHSWGATVMKIGFTTAANDGGIEWWRCRAKKATPSNPIVSALYLQKNDKR